MNGEPRWAVRVLAVEGAPPDPAGRGRVLRSFHRYTAAKRYADAHSKEYQNGVVIDDRLFGIVDTGDGWCDYAGAVVRAPFYAVRRLA